VISAFVENVATVLIVAPIALALADKLKFSPVKMMIGIAISSNLQGAATLIGDPPSMLLGGFAKMNFMDFFFYQGKPSIFFAVEIGMVFSMIVLWFFFRKDRRKMSEVSVEKVKSWFPSIVLVLLVVALATSSFFDTEFSYAAGLICMVAGVICLVWRMLISNWKGDGTETKQHRFFMNLHHRFDVAWKTLKTLDWETTLFLAGVFILVGGLTATGWDTRIAAWLARLVAGNVLIAFVMIVGMSVLLSAFIDNVPYLAAMLPVAMDLSRNMNIAPSLLLFGLLIGASLGGNVTPIGASANVVACGLLKKRGQTVGFGTFMKMGLPFTIVATVAASTFIWLVWGPK
jgi:Na+/H+ antiporter NhaD/arsenite permease-like protein